MFSIVPAGHKFIDRGNRVAVDKSVGDFITDTAYHDLDLSAIVGVRRALVLLRFSVRTPTANSSIFVRTKGNANEINVGRIITQVANQYIDDSKWVWTDVNGVIEYMIVNVTWTNLDFLVRGWFA